MMTKTSAKSQQNSNEGAALLLKLQELGDYYALRKQAKRMLQGLEPQSVAAKNVLEIIQRTEPNPLVFWIGFGSVFVAMALAAWLAY